MEEIPHLISKKRHWSLSSPSPLSCPHQPFTGTFTRSKSQIYVHSNRSGSTRSDSFRISQHHVNLRSSPVGFESSKKKKKKKSKTQFQSKKKKPVTALTREESTDTDDLSCIFIKDLRTRRVFSLASMDNRCELCVDDDEEGKKGSEKGTAGFEDVFLSFNGSKNSESLTKSDSFIDQEDMMQSNVGYSSQQQNSINMSEIDGNLRNDGGGNGNLSSEASDVNEECVQATPPDAEILHRDNNMECAFSKLSTENHGNIEGLQENNTDMKISGSKSGINPWSRVRVFKAPGSLSYRRLLPYLMDLVQDHSCSPKKGILPNIDTQRIPKDAPTLADGLSDVSGTDSNLKSSECITDSSMLHGSQKIDSKRVGSPILLADQTCSQSPADDVNDNIKIKVSNKDKDFESSTLDCPSMVYNPQVNGYSDDAKPPDSGEDKVVVSDHPCNAQDANDGSIQMTQADADIFVKTLAYRGVDNRNKLISQNADQVPGKLLKGSTHRNNSYFRDKRVDSSSKSKWGLNPCSQLKLFKARSSYNYRRMLPYLMDIANDKFGVSKNGKCPKLEKSLQENLVSPSSASDLNETPIEKLNGSSHMEHDTDSFCPRMSSLPASNQLNLIPSDHNTDIPVSIASQEDKESQIILNASYNKDGQSDSSPGIVSLVHGSCSVAMPICSSLVSPQSVHGEFLDLVSQELFAKNEENSRKSIVQVTNAAKPVEEGNFAQTSSILVASHHPLAVPANGLVKSILKRHPRGCRGLCTCLNCASFRLHAERAFEFSKNQMLDAEEVALDLIKELSHVRNMLEKAASVSNNNLIICNDQVKEACRKASEAEELAKNRLSQMNYDLDIHCRISGGERPRVRFANNVETRIFHG